jgi:putative nucleotidyltransferase with HDIG domain
MGTWRIADESSLAGHPTKRWVHDRLVELLDSETAAPAFSPVVTKLIRMMGDEATVMDDIADIVALDPGLATRCLRSANCAANGAKRMSTVPEALFLIGLHEMRGIALTVGVMDNFNHLRIQVNWRKFWLHSVLVARLTDRIAGAFREASGMEYLAALLHDLGKLVLEHFFPREFEACILRAMERRCGHAAAELDLLGFDHTAIGAALCAKLNLHPHIIHAVRFHHQALHPAHTDDPAGDGGFLAACISVADYLANLRDINIGGSVELAGTLDELPEWKFLTTYFACRGLDLDLDEEIKLAEQEIGAIL